MPDGVGGTLICCSPCTGPAQADVGQPGSERGVCWDHMGQGLGRGVEGGLSKGAEAWGLSASGK